MSKRERESKGWGYGNSWAQKEAKDESKQIKNWVGVR